MGAPLVLTLGTEPSPWTTYLGVGIIVAVAGALVLFLYASEVPGAGGLTEGAELLGFFLVGLGCVTAVAGIGMHWFELRTPRPLP